MFAINVDLLSFYVNCMPLEGPKLVNKICYVMLCYVMYVTYSMHKMSTAGVPSGTILAVHLQKCSH